VDVALEKRQVQRAYELYAPVYDFVFDWIFAPGRSAAVSGLALQRSDSVLEVGIGTGLNMPLYPWSCHLTGIDLSQEMLDKAVERVQSLAMPNVVLKVMDATSMDFGENEFDKAVATYTISAVPDPVAVLREMRRVVKPDGIIVILNHFRSHRRITGWAEDLLAPVCTRLGWKSNLVMAPLLEQVGLVPESITHVNMFKGWRLVKCINRK
jgi:phosphatidylethanolamine/phosphatidyl-N-methylethanolamine N-methyltransferase